MTVLDVRNLTKSFGGAAAVNDISFAVDRGEILVIVGGSGCGKTTTLRCIAGLETPTAGTILLDGRVVASADISIPPERRGIGMVFQSYALWPHKTVAQNVAYGLERAGKPKAEIRDLVAAILGKVGLAALGDRFPSMLSGGQQQRVALARSAVMEPKLLLLDEPLSNLDAKLREQMRDELKEMIRLLGMTAVHITHDQGEAMALADRIICMSNGRIEQVGTPRELYRAPTTRFVADFIGSSSILEGMVVASSEPGPAGNVLVRINEHLAITAWQSHKPVRKGPVLIAIRPEAITLLDESDGRPNILKATIERETFLGSHSEYSIGVGGVLLKALDTRDRTVGATCFIYIDPQRVACLPESG